MSQDVFEQRLRENIRRKPFVPFLVEMNDGKRIYVDYPSVTFCDGEGIFFNEDDLYTFECEDVKSIRPANAVEASQ